MTFFITMAFIIRSSSIIGWIPLALYKIFSSEHYLHPILEAGVKIAIPTFLISLSVDSFFYGQLMCPQLNFVKLNVVDNLSSHFGTEHTWYYLLQIDNYLQPTYMLRQISYLGFSLFSVMHVQGQLYYHKKHESETFPALTVFIFVNLIVISLIPHKEMRFMSQILPLVGIFWSNFWLVAFKFENEIISRMKLQNLTIPSFSKLLFLINFWLFFYFNYNECILDFNKESRSFIEIYNLLHGRSSLLLDYSHLNDSEVQLTDVESFYVNEKYDNPPTVWAHTPGDKITVTYNSFTQPKFMMN